MNSASIAALALGLSLICTSSFVSAGAPEVPKGSAAPRRGMTMGVPVTLGSTVADVQRALGTPRLPVPVKSLNAQGEQEHQGQTVLRLADKGISVFFNADDRVRHIRLDPPFAGMLAGVQIGDAEDSVLGMLGLPRRPTVSKTLPDAARTRLEELSRHRHLYNVDNAYQAAFDIDPATKQVKTMWIGRLPTARTASAAASCQDPLLDGTRFRVTNTEIEDTKTGLVWHRCPGMHTSPGGTCEESVPLPAQTWAGAMSVPPDKASSGAGWRLASVEELDTIAARGCGYIVNPGRFNLMFDRLWTRSSAGGDLVFKYGMDRTRKAAAKGRTPGDDSFAQMLYVRPRR